MKQITKDTKISVDVRNCTPKQKGLVIDRFSCLGGNRITNRAESINEAVIVNFNYDGGGWSYTSSGHFHNPKVITFKQFLKAANPYKGVDYEITLDTPRQHKKAQKRLFKMGYKWMFSGRVLENYKSQCITLQGMDMLNQSYSYPKLTYSQFMNFELPEDKPEKLMFGEYEVIDRGNTFRVGCQSFTKEGVKNLMLLINGVKKHSIDPAEVVEWLMKNGDKLNLTTEC